MFLENALKGLAISLVTGIIGIVITYLFWWIYKKIKKEVSKCQTKLSR